MQAHPRFITGTNNSSQPRPSIQSVAANPSRNDTYEPSLNKARPGQAITSAEVKFAAKSQRYGNVNKHVTTSI